MSELRSGLAAPGDQLLAGLGLDQPDLSELRRPPPPAVAPPAAAPPPGSAPGPGGGLPPELQWFYQSKSAAAPDQPAPDQPRASSVTSAPSLAPSIPPQGPIGSPQRQVYPFGDLSTVDPVPDGRTPLMTPQQALQTHQSREIAKLPPDPTAEFVLKGLNEGRVYDQHFQPYRMAMGPLDPMIQAQQAQATSAGGAAGGAPYRPGTLRVNVPGVGTIETPGSEEEQAAYNRTGQLPPRLAMLGGGAGGGGGGPPGGLGPTPGAPSPTPGGPSPTPGGPSPTPGGPSPTGGAPSPAAAGAFGPAAGPAVQPAVTTPLAQDYPAAQTEVAKLKDNALNAQTQLTTIGDVRDLMNTVKTGNFAEVKKELGSKLIALGWDPAKVASLTGNNVADAEALTKSFWQLATQNVVGNLGPGQAASTLQEGLAASPNLALQPGAINLMTNIMSQQARAQQQRYNAASDVFLKPPPGGNYGPGGMYGAVLNAENGVNQRYNGENVLRSAQLMTQGHHTNAWGAPGSLGPDGAPTPQSQSYLDLIPPGVTFYNPNGDAYRKDASGRPVRVQ